MVRGVGLIRSLDEIRNTMLTQTGGVPVLVSDVANVIVSNQPRLGIAGKDNDDDIVQGIVLMRRGEKSMPTIQRVQAEVERINSSHILPPGVRIERIYDRKDLIDITTSTVLHNMVVGIGLIFFLQWVFLGNLRSAVIVGMTIPFALFFAVGILVMRGESANLLSVGAIDFGLIVDATVIMVESIFRWLSGHGNRDATEEAIRTLPPAGLHGKRLAIFHAAADVNRSIFFAAGIIIAGFIPLFTLSGVEGHIFGPMAQTYAYALAGGLIATFTVTPALSALILPEHVQETETFVVRVLHRVYTPVLDFSIRHKAVTVGAAHRRCSWWPASRCACSALEFLPKLEEGNLWIRATLAVDDLAGGGQRLRQPDAPGRLQLPGGGVRRFAARPPGRRHRRRRLLQRRVLRAAQAARASGGRKLDKDDLTERGARPSCRPNSPASNSTSRSTCRTTSPRPCPA